MYIRGILTCTRVVCARGVTHVTGTIVTTICTLIGGSMAVDRSIIITI